jgi:hypothetical protein
VGSATQWNGCHSFDDENGLNLKAGSSMEFAIGLRKWAVLRVSSLSPAGETMKSSLTSMMESFDGFFFIMGLKLYFKKVKSLL